MNATEEHLPAITAIYNDIVISSTAIYRDEPTTVAERMGWWRSREEKGFATLVAYRDGAVLGFSSFGDFRAAPGYRFTVEHTVHVAASSRGQGVGSMLVRALLPRAAALGTRDGGRNRCGEYGVAAVP